MARVCLLGSVDDLAPGDTRIVPYPSGRPPYRSIIVLCTDAGEIRAFWNVCKHLPVPLDSGTGQLPPGDRLVCLTHGARFAKEDGRCVAGPCRGARLEPVRTERAGSALYARVAE